jgi:hypothetical protein
MAHGDAREGKWRGNWRMEWVASTLHTTSEQGVSSITTVDAHASAASSRRNWRPRRFKWTRPFRRRTKSGFCACHHISNAVYHSRNGKKIFGPLRFRYREVTFCYDMLGALLAVLRQIWMYMQLQTNNTTLYCAMWIIFIRYWMPLSLSDRVINCKQTFSMLCPALRSTMQIVSKSMTINRIDHGWAKCNSWNVLSEQHRSIALTPTNKLHLRDKWVPVTTARRVLRVRMEERPPIWRVAANISKEQSRTADKGWSPSLGIGRGPNNCSP